MFQTVNIFVSSFWRIDLALQQTQLEHELEKVQQERDSNRARLLSYIYNGIITTFFENIYLYNKQSTSLLF